MRKLKNHKQTLLSILVLACFCATVSYATIPTNQTLNPDCIPTDIGCTISPFNTSGPLSYNPATGTMSISAASNTDAGYLTTGTQTIAGNKTFSGNIAGINGVAYVFPVSQGGAGSYFVNDGAGNLSWAPGSSFSWWSTAGNSTTTAGINFIGTTDAQDLVFKTNSIERLRLTSTGTFLLAPTNNGTITTPGAGAMVMASAYDVGTTLTPSGASSILMGAAYTSGSLLRTSGFASTVMGVAGYGGTPGSMTASGTGSFIVGYADAGSMTASGTNSVIFSSTIGTGSPIITGSGNGTFTRVLVQDGGTVTNAGPGVMISGMVSGATSSLTSRTASNGGHLFGAAFSGGTIMQNSPGGLVAGYAENSGIIRSGHTVSNAHGAFAFGYANGGTIMSESDGSLAGGYAPAGANVYNSGVASFVWGSGVSNGTTLAASDYGFVFGKNISNTTANTMVVGWDTIQLTINSTGVTANTFLRAGSSSIITGTAVAQFQNAGGTCSVTPSTSGGITCSSDITLKKNITTLNNTAPFSLQNLSIQSNLSILDKMLLITPVQYNWNAETDQTQKHTGFIAQEVEQVFPDLVLTDTATNLKSLNYAGFTPYLAQAIKDLDIKTNNIKLAQDNYQNTLFGTLRSFFADAQNGIESIVAGRVRTREVCLVDIEGKTCVDKDALIAVFQQIPSGEK